MKDTKKHGGTRPKSGRKKMPKIKKKQTVSVYLTGEVIQAHGGLTKVKDKIYELFN